MIKTLSALVTLTPLTPSFLCLEDAVTVNFAIFEKLTYCILRKYNSQYFLKQQHVLNLSLTFIYAYLVNLVYFSTNHR